MNIDIMQYFNDVIYLRGLEYYRDNLVTYVKKVGNRYTAIVEGTYPYDVKIKIKYGKVLDMTCSCPYGMYNNCKHMAATLIYINNKFKDIKSDKKIKRRLKLKKSYIIKQVNKIPEKKLKEYVIELLNNNEYIYNDFIQKNMSAPKILINKSNIKDKIEVIKQDITTLKVDAIVNAANISLLRWWWSRWCNT